MRNIQLVITISLLFACIFNADAIVIIVDTTNPKYQVRYSEIDFSAVYYFYFPLLVNQEYHDFIQLTDKNDELEISIKTNSGFEKVEIPDEYLKRIRDIVVLNWSQVLQFNLLSNDNSKHATNNPPCAYIMYFIRFGYTNYIDGWSPLCGTTRLGYDLRLILDKLEIGDVVQFRNDSDLYISDTFLCLSRGIFLYWDRLFAKFYIRGSDHLESDQIIKNKYINKVWQLVPSPVTIESVLDAWKKLNQNISANDYKSFEVFSDDSNKRLMINSQTSPSYIK